MDSSPDSSVAPLVVVASLGAVVLAAALASHRRVPRPLGAVALAAAAGTLAFALTTAVAHGSIAAEGRLLASSLRLVRVGALDLTASFAFGPARAVLAALVFLVSVLVVVRRMARGLPLTETALAFAGAQLVLVANDVLVVLVGWSLATLAASFGTRGARRIGATRREADGLLLLAAIVLSAQALGGAWEARPMLEAREPVESGREESADASAVGSLSVLSPPRAVVYLDDAATLWTHEDGTPVRVPFTRVALAPGAHSLRIRTDTAGDEVYLPRVRIAPGALTVVDARAQSSSLAHAVRGAKALPEPMRIAVAVVLVLALVQRLVRRPLSARATDLVVPVALTVALSQHGPLPALAAALAALAVIARSQSGGLALLAMALVLAGEVAAGCALASVALVVDHEVLAALALRGRATASAPVAAWAAIPALVFGAVHAVTHGEHVIVGALLVLSSCWLAACEGAYARRAKRTALATVVTALFSVSVLVAVRYLLARAGADGARGPISLPQSITARPAVVAVVALAPVVAHLAGRGAKGAVRALARQARRASASGGFAVAGALAFVARGAVLLERAAASAALAALDAVAPALALRRPTRVLPARAVASHASWRASIVIVLACAVALALLVGLGLARR